MTHRYALEALDQTLRDIAGVDLPFGGKVVVLGGDFRQVLPVVPKGGKSEMIDACIVRSYLWSEANVLRLKENMRSRNDQQFSEYLLRVGEGTEPTIADEMIEVNSTMVVDWEGPQSVDRLIEEVFPNLDLHANNQRYMTDRALVTPLNEHVDMLNKKVIQKYMGDERIDYSYDKIENDARLLYQPEFLNSITPGGLPPYVLRLKKGPHVMLLRNIDPKIGLCNGTRLLCRDLHDT